MQTPSNFTTKKKNSHLTKHNILQSSNKWSQNHKRHEEPTPIHCMHLFTCVAMCVRREQCERGRIWGVWGITWIPQNPAACSNKPADQELEGSPSSRRHDPKKISMLWDSRHPNQREEEEKKKNYHHKYLAFFYC